MEQLFHNEFAVRRPGVQSQGFLVAIELSEVQRIEIGNVLALDTPEALRSTVSVQLALLSSGVAVARALDQEGVRPLAVAGLSAGVFSAAVVAGVLRLADGVRLVKQRGEMMARLYPRGYGLAVIVGLNETQVSIHLDTTTGSCRPWWSSSWHREAMFAGAHPALAMASISSPRRV